MLELFPTHIWLGPLTCTCDTGRRSPRTSHTPRGGQGLRPGSEDTAASQILPEREETVTRGVSTCRWLCGVASGLFFTVPGGCRRSLQTR